MNLASSILLFLLYFIHALLSRSDRALIYYLHDSINFIKTSQHSPSRLSSSANKNTGLKIGASVNISAKAIEFAHLGSKHWNIYQSVQEQNRRRELQKDRDRLRFGISSQPS